MAFKNYELVKVDNQAMLQKAKSNRAIEIRAYGRTFEFDLTPNDIRAANYRAIETNGSGSREMELAEVTTYKGKLSADENSEVRFTITDNKVEGMIYTGEGRKFYITKAENFSNKAQKEDVVVYSEGDLNKTIDLSNDSPQAAPGDVEGMVGFGLAFTDYYSNAGAAMALTNDGLDSTAAALQTVEVATEADLQWVNQAGGGAAANNEILSILNLVDGIYRRDLNLSVVVTFQHVWTTADPFSSASTSDELNSFLSYWNSNFPVSQYPRDTTHLFTGKFSNQGIAYQGVMCRSQSYAYGLTARSGNANHMITAHEIGHNLGAEHVDNSGSCANSIMNPSLTPYVTAFCEISKSQVSNYVASNGTCLGSTGTTTTPTPTPTPTATPTPTPSCSYSITPSSQSFSSSGGSGTVNVFTQGGCSWSANSNQYFVSLSSGGSGFGNGTVSYYVDQNTGSSSRSATITVAGKYFTVQQSGITLSSSNTPLFDYDGDGRADISVFRPSNGTWYINRSSTNSSYGYSFGQAGDLVAPADFDGDRKTDIAVFRPSNGTWYYVKSSTGQFSSTQFGQTGDIPVPGDYDGDGRADISVFRSANGSWYRLNSSTGQFVGVQFGQLGDTPVLGNFDGDSRSDIAVFRPSTGSWYILRSSTGTFYGVTFGQTGDIPTPADFDGDGRTDTAVYRPSAGSWYRLNSSNNSFFGQQFGIAADKPVAADFDGDGRADLAVFRPTTGNWYLQRSSSGFTGMLFGAIGDIPTEAITLPQ